MLTHVVMFRLNDRRPEAVAAAKARLDGLAGEIPVLRSIEVGEDILHSGRSYDLVLIARFDDLVGLEAYQSHPAHVPVQAYLRAACESIIAVDYTSTGEGL